jgi:hypothetical protein
MDGETKSDNYDIFHERAEHEDRLNMSRLSYFLSANGFLAVAVGLTDEKVLKIIFTVVILTLNILWILWSPRAWIFIRALRNAGAKRADERIWRLTVGEHEEKRRWLRDPLIIVGYYVPFSLSIGWAAILIYLAVNYINI